MLTLRNDQLNAVASKAVEKLRARGSYPVYGQSASRLASALARRLASPGVPAATGQHVASVMIDRLSSAVAERLASARLAPLAGARTRYVTSSAQVERLASAVAQRLASKRIESQSASPRTPASGRSGDLASAEVVALADKIVDRLCTRQTLATQADAIASLVATKLAAAEVKAKEGADALPIHEEDVGKEKEASPAKGMRKDAK